MRPYFSCPWYTVKLAAATCIVNAAKQDWAPGREKGKQQLTQPSRCTPTLALITVTPFVILGLNELLSLTAICPTCLF